MYFHGNRNKKEIALTFDDGPAEATLELLKVLKKYKVKATFFVVGKMIKDREYIIKHIKNEGHEIGNHTFSHKRLWFKSRDFIENEIIKCDEELKRVGIETNLIRFPGLKYGPNAVMICKKLKKVPIFAEFLTLNQFAYDWFKPWLRKRGFIKGEIKIDTVTKRTTKYTKNGSILVFHDYLQEIGPNPEIILIIDKVIPALQAKGFKFVTISELFEL